MLTRRQVTVAALHGAMYWALAVLFIRVAGPPLFVHGSPRLVALFVVLVPVSWAFVELAPRAAGFSGASVGPAVTVMCLTALILDGVALAWASSLYGVARPALVLPAAWLLCWFGVLLAFALRKAARPAASDAGPAPGGRARGVRG